jgi:hypothetical protein
MAEDDTQIQVRSKTKIKLDRSVSSIITLREYVM